MIVDATCAPSNIRYPQDVSLLNEARENAEKLLDVLHDSADGKKPRTYRKRARKDYLKYTRCRKHTAKMTRKAIGKQLAYLRRDLDAIDGKLSLGKNLPPRQTERLDTIRAVYEQQKYMYDNRTHSVPDRIVSVSQPFVRPIVRGKAGKPVEFGAKLDISVVDGWKRLECCSFDAYNEAGNLQEMTERFRAREGYYPSRILADKIYRNWENLSYCKAHGIRLSGPALGRPKKGETRDKAQDYRDECERVEVERRFSLAKRKCGMGLVTAKLRETAAHVIVMSVLVLNLRKIQRALLRMLAYLLEILAQNKNWALVQWTLISSGDDFYIDLLFYNLNLRCYVVIELKTGEFKPEYAGQLNFYLSAVDDILKKEQDSPSIGLLLCKSKNDLVAEYSLKDMSKPMGVSAYQITSNLPEELEKQLPSVEDIQKRIQNI